ncbi:NAD-dependent epimerase/dehydratase family protein [Cupriavidus basilensis]|uniref:dTDP-glucose 4,6-dehydratase n=1 Tax=Cupriavidus basilensis TaxID=68895 RepID=A0A0C4YD63_9BURK|nr:NAD(P)-dependent oxidoreductase [Cupriavidus basilensis]AJG20715.1 dTDP-glucose 4,6-dehydratase [Cupriavidus basilensis]
MTVLITGGSGFIGLNVAACLLSRGDTVIAFGPEPPPAPAFEQLSELAGTFLFKSGDVRDRGSIVDALRHHDVSRVIHGAAITASLAREHSQAPLIAEVNLIGTLNVLDAACAAGVHRVVHLSSGAVYGMGGHGQTELVEDRDVPEPESLYGITKYAAERAALRYRATRSLDVIVARLGVVFGRWEYDTGVRDTMSIPLLLAQLAEARHPARFCADLPDDWLYAGDAADAIVGITDAINLAHSLYHIGTGRRWSPSAWCERLRAVYPGFTYERVARRQDANVGVHAPAARPPFSVERLRQDLGFAPRFHEERAFSDYLQWRASVYEGAAQGSTGS